MAVGKRIATSSTEQLRPRASTEASKSTSVESSEFPLSPQTSSDNPNQLFERFEGDLGGARNKPTAIIDHGSLESVRLGRDTDGPQRGNETLNEAEGRPSSQPHNPFLDGGGADTLAHAHHDTVHTNNALPGSSQGAVAPDAQSHVIMNTAVPRGSDRLDSQACPMCGASDDLATFGRSWLCRRIWILSLTWITVVILLLYLFPNNTSQFGSVTIDPEDTHPRWDMPLDALLFYLLLIITSFIRLAAAYMNLNCTASTCGCYTTVTEEDHGRIQNNVGRIRYAGNIQYCLASWLVQLRMALYSLCAVCVLGMVVTVDVWQRRDRPYDAAAGRDMFRALGYEAFVAWLSASLASFASPAARETPYHQIPAGFTLSKFQAWGAALPWIVVSVLLGAATFAAIIFLMATNGDVKNHQIGLLVCVIMLFLVETFLLSLGWPYARSRMTNNSFSKIWRAFPYKRRRRRNYIELAEADNQNEIFGITGNDVELAVRKPTPAHLSEHSATNTVDDSNATGQGARPILGLVPHLRGGARFETAMTFGDYKTWEKFTFKLWCWGLPAFVLALGALIITPILWTSQKHDKGLKLNRMAFLIFIISGSIIAGVWLTTFVAWRVFRVYRMRYLALRDVRVRRSTLRLWTSVRSDSFDSDKGIWRRRLVGTRQQWLRVAIIWSIMNLAWAAGVAVPTYELMRTPSFRSARAQGKDTNPESNINEPSIKQGTWQIPVLVISAVFILVTPFFWLPYAHLRRQDHRKAEARFHLDENEQQPQTATNDERRPSGEGGVYVNGTPLAERTGPAEHVIDGHPSTGSPMGKDGASDPSKADALAKRLSSIEEEHSPSRQNTFDVPLHVINKDISVESFPRLASHSKAETSMQGVTDATCSCIESYEGKRHLTFADGTANSKSRSKKRQDREDSSTSAKNEVQTRGRSRSNEVHSRDGIPNIIELNPHGNLAPLTRAKRHVSFDLPRDEPWDSEQENHLRQSQGKKKLRFKFDNSSSDDSGKCSGNGSDSTCESTDTRRTSTSSTNGSAFDERGSARGAYRTQSERAHGFAGTFPRVSRRAGGDGGGSTFMNGKVLSRWLRGYSDPSQTSCSDEEKGVEPSINNRVQMGQGKADSTLEGVVA